MVNSFPVPPHPNDLIQTLVDSGILSTEEAGKLAPSAGGHGEGAAQQPLESASEFVDRLKQLGRLSDFQIEVLERDGPDGILLGDYILIDRIGVGGMGEVYRAVHRVMRREVAIKRLKTGSIQVPGLADRFMREVRTAAKLVHPNIVTAFDAGEDEDGCYLAMEYVEGRDLSKVLREDGPLPVDRAADFLLQAARALAYAHETGIIHRDVKPGNFLVDRSGTLKLLDLGLARVEQTIMDAEHSIQLTLTHASHLVGTLAYMAPEQADNPHAASVAADLYALGCTFCSMVTGRPPFSTQSTTGVLIAHRDSPPPDLRHCLPGALNDLYRRLLAKNPADRPASAKELIQTLEPMVADGSLSAWARDLAEAETLVGPLAAGERPAPAPILGAPTLATHVPSKPAQRPLLRWIVAALAVAAAVVGLVIALGGNGTSPGSAAAPSPPGQAPALPDAIILNSSGAAAAQQKNQAQQAELPVDVRNKLGMTFRYVPEGSYRRGSSEEQIEWALEQIKSEGLFDRYGEFISSEGPQTVVPVERPFYMADTEVTVGQFRKFVEAAGYRTLAETDGIGGINFSTGAAEIDANWKNPGMTQNDDHPVVNLTQVDAIAFCEWLSKEEDVLHRLPEENEWEYACRAGSPGRWCFGDDPSQFFEYGWCVYNSPNSTKPVGTRKPNAFGLYDMHGNAREWVLANDGTASDKYGTGILRGGSFTKPQVLLRSSSRMGFKVRSPYPYHGFRVLREIAPGASSEK